VASSAAQYFGDRIGNALIGKKPSKAVKKPDSRNPPQRLLHRPASSSGFEGSYLQFAANLRCSVPDVGKYWLHDANALALELPALG
jgi:hypothetical protein